MYIVPKVYDEYSCIDASSDLALMHRYYATKIKGLYEQEEWKQIPAFPEYSVSNLGRIRHIRNIHIPLYNGTYKNRSEVYCVLKYRDKVQSFPVRLLVGILWFLFPSDYTEPIIVPNYSEMRGVFQLFPYAAKCIHWVDSAYPDDLINIEYNKYLKYKNEELQKLRKRYSRLIHKQNKEELNKFIYAIMHKKTWTKLDKNNQSDKMKLDWLVNYSINYCVYAYEHNIISLLDLPKRIRKQVKQEYKRRLQQIQIEKEKAIQLEKEKKEKERKALQNKLQQIQKELKVKQRLWYSKYTLSIEKAGLYSKAYYDNIQDIYFSSLSEIARFYGVSKQAINQALKITNKSDKYELRKVEVDEPLYEFITFWLEQVNKLDGDVFEKFDNALNMFNLLAYGVYKVQIILDIIKDKEQHVLKVYIDDKIYDCIIEKYTKRYYWTMMKLNMLLDN